MSDDTTNLLNANEYYGTYHGHEVKHLQRVLDHVKYKNTHPSAGIIYLIGDSTLDNKFWFRNEGAATNGYESILDPAISKQDICHWINFELERRGYSDRYTTLNCAVEESTIGGRTCCLRPQDLFVRENFTKNDVLVVSMGGNDIALAPSLCTVLNAAFLVCTTSTSCLENYTCGTSLPCEEYFCGCSSACLSNFLAWPFGYGYFLHLFGTRLKHVVTRILATRKEKPAKIVVCMLYYLDITSGNSWAETSLGALGYNRNPSHLQALIRSVYRDATEKIRISGVEVVAVPLFKSLDGEDTSDYCARVEPSASGGKKMAAQLVDAIVGVVGVDGSSPKGCDKDKDKDVIIVSDEDMQR